MLSRRVVILHLENLDRPYLVRIPVGSSGRFSLSYTHSMYDAPVIEELEVLGDRIFLVGVRTKSPAVAEYYGFDTRGEFHPLHRGLGEIRLRIGMGEAQRLSCARMDVSLASLGASGDLAGSVAGEFAAAVLSLTSRTYGQGESSILKSIKAGWV